MKPIHGLLWACAFIASPALAEPLKMSTLRRALEAHPEAAWTARDSSAAVTFAGKKEAFGLPAGYRASLDAAPAYDFPAPLTAPRALDWRAKDGLNWVSPVKNQGRCGSCVAFAAIATFEAGLNIATGAPALDFDGSEQDLFGRIGECENGASPSSAPLVLKSRGAVDEACFPYVSGRLGLDQSRGVCADAAQRGVKISSSQFVPVSGVKAALQRGPVMTTLSVYEDFMFYGGGVYRHVAGAYQGGHAVTIVGYDDDARYWIVKNSWGEDWGERGFVRVSYDDVSGIGQENYALNLATPDVLVKVAAPVNGAAVAGDLTVALETVGDAPTGTISYALTPRTGGRGVTGSAPAGARDLTVDTTALADGVYELKVAATLGDGRASRPWYSLVTVANQPQAIAVALAADAFDPSRPVNGRVYFLINTRAGAVPLTAVDVEISQDDGTPVKTITLQDPGPQSKFGWRTAMYPNGRYRLKAVGKVGSLQAFASAEFAVTVAN